VQPLLILEESLVRILDFEPFLWGAVTQYAEELAQSPEAHCTPEQVLSLHSSNESTHLPL
jgi:hypothetical protein